MKVTAVIDVRCPKCGQDPNLAVLMVAVKNGGMYQCEKCSRVNPMPQAVRLVEVTGAAVPA